MHSIQHDLSLILACLLNTYLDGDASVDWAGTWADRLVDGQFDIETTVNRTATGLMNCGRLGNGWMHLTPFQGEFFFSSGCDCLESYELKLAAEGPWDRAGTESAIPFTHDKEVRLALLSSRPEIPYGLGYCISMLNPKRQRGWFLRRSWRCPRKPTQPLCWHRAVTSGLPRNYSRTTAMTNDPIVDSVRRVRDELAAKFNYDVHAIFADMRTREGQLGDRLVSQPSTHTSPAKPPSPNGSRQA